MKFLLKTTLFLGFVLAPLLAMAAPGIPHQFYGNVVFESGTTPDGLLVEAKVNAVVVGTSKTKSGKYGIMPTLLMVSKSDGEWSGETVRFFVAGIDTSETHTLQKGGYTNLNLTVPGSVGTITKGADDTVIDTTVAVTLNAPVIITFGNALEVTLSSSAGTSATIEKIEKIQNNFFTGATAILSGQNLLNAYEIKVVGDNLSISVTMYYDDSGIEESTVKPYRWSGTAWVEIIPFTRNTAANTLTFTIASAATPYVVFGSSTPTPPPPPPPALSSGGDGGISGSGGGSTSGGGGGSGVTTPTIPTSPLSVAAQKVDANKDNKINVLDFNTLMVNWGSAGANNAADFDGNGKVDVFDFNLLMINWTL